MAASALGARSEWGHRLGATHAPQVGLRERERGRGRGRENRGGVIDWEQSKPGKWKEMERDRERTRKQGDTRRLALPVSSSYALEKV